MTTNLTQQEHNLFVYMKKCGVGRDVYIGDIHWTLYRDEEADAQRRQQRVGAIVSRVNIKIKEEGLAIKPGELKRTYRLVKL